MTTFDPDFTGTAQRILPVETIVTEVTAENVRRNIRFEKDIANVCDEHGNPSPAVAGMLADLDQIMRSDDHAEALARSLLLGMARYAPLADVERALAHIGGPANAAEALARFLAVHERHRTGAATAAPAQQTQCEG